MPQIKEFTIGVRHLINLGDYENITVEAHVTCMTSENTVNAGSLAAAQEYLKMLLRETYKTQKRPNKESVSSRADP